MKIMKRIALYSVAAVCFASCLAEDQIPTYEGENHIYFGESTDSLLVSFAFYPGQTDSVVSLSVQVLGLPVGTDRPYTLNVAGSSTAEEGVHYDFSQDEDFTVPADSTGDEVQVILHRTSDLEADTVFIGFELQSNEHFNTDIDPRVVNELTGETVSYTSFRLFSSDVLGEPSGWSSSFLGDFSQAKLYLMADVLDIDVSIFTSNVDNYTLFYYGTFMQRYLDQQEDAGDTVYEDDGTTPMSMGPSVQ